MSKKTLKNGFSAGNRPTFIRTERNGKVRIKALNFDDGGVKYVLDFTD